MLTFDHDYLAEEFCEIEEDENNRDCDREPVIKEKLRDRIKELNPEQQSILYVEFLVHQMPNKHLK